MKKIDWTKWSAVAEILSAIAIVSTLAYLALQTEQSNVQIRQNNDLLSQTIDIAEMDRRHVRTNINMNWAALVAQNAKPWTAGLADEQLTDSDAEIFDVLARAWFYDVYQNWENSQNEAFDTNYELSALTQSFIRNAALEVVAHPGLRRWVEERQE
jgi:hypothetical protein